ncbi:MAG: BrnT family toxin [Thermoanaerobaculia bacterium]
MIDKLEAKHGVSPEEVEEVLFARPHTRRLQRGRVPGEDLYLAYGRTDAQRFLVVFFLLKGHEAALPISAREMTHSERRYYEGHAT